MHELPGASNITCKPFRAMRPPLANDREANELSSPSRTGVLPIWYAWGESIISR